MATEAITRAPDLEAIERLVIGGDLSRLNAEQKVSYYRHYCESVGLNWLTRPLEFLQLQGKLVLYARREASEQLRKANGISVTKIEKERDTELGVFSVTAYLLDRSGRTDVGTGAVGIAGLKGQDLANAMMKAETKAKRRGTLSISGLGIMDESEIEDVRSAVVEMPDPAQLQASSDEYASRVEAEQAQEAKWRQDGAIQVSGEVESVAAAKSGATWYEIDNRLLYVKDNESLRNELLTVAAGWNLDLLAMPEAAKVKGMDALQILKVFKKKAPAKPRRKKDESLIAPLAASVDDALGIGDAEQQYMENPDSEPTECISPAIDF